MQPVDDRTWLLCRALAGGFSLRGYNYEARQLQKYAMLKQRHVIPHLHVFKGINSYRLEEASQAADLALTVRL